MKVYPFIAAEKAADRHVATACRLLSVSRSAYYIWSRQERSEHAKRDEELAQAIRRIHGASRGTYGAPRVHQQLRREGTVCSRKRVARLMAQLGLKGCQRRRTQRTRVADAAATQPMHDLLERAFTPAPRALDTAWVGDITYLRTGEGWAYLATVIDLASRRVVGFAVANHMRAQLVQEAMEMGLRTRRPAPGLIFHSDRGSQYTSSAFRALLERHGVRQSLSRPRQCWDNAVAESFFATLKKELIHRGGWPTVARVRTAVFEYIEVFYNRRRLHSSLGYHSPADYERLAAHTDAAPAA